MIELTRADKIRSMSDKEMAEKLIPMLYDLCEDGVPCEEYMLNWLKHPYEPEE